jgi:hypothetical protein
MVSGGCHLGQVELVSCGDCFDLFLWRGLLFLEGARIDLTQQETDTLNQLGDALQGQHEKSHGDQ